MFGCHANLEDWRAHCSSVLSSSPSYRHSSDKDGNRPGLDKIEQSESASILLLQFSRVIVGLFFPQITVRRYLSVEIAHRQL